MAGANKRSTAKKATDWKLPHIERKTFVFTGRISKSMQSLLEKLIGVEGGSIVKDVTADLNYLIVGVGETRGSGPSGAEKKAASLNQRGRAEIRILDEAGFKQLFVRDRETAIALLQSGQKGVALWNETVATNWLRLSIDVTNADFRNGDLRDASLYHAKRDGSDFRGAQLSGAKFGRIRDAKFDKATGIVTIEHAENCSFKGADLGSEDESNSSRIGAVDSNFDGANIRYAVMESMQNCSYRRIAAIGATLNEIDFSEGDFKGAKLAQINSWKLKAARARFNGVDLRESHLLDCNFHGASFRKTTLIEASVKECEFSEADLTQGNLENATGHDANFQNADLTKAKLRGAQLCDADFRGAVLDGADFTDTVVDGAKLSDEQI